MSNPLYELALSLWNPHAFLVQVGEKRWETRSWSTLYRGPLLIHVAKSFPHVARKLCAEEPFRSVITKHTGQSPTEFVRTCQRGVILARVNLVDVVEITPRNVPAGNEFHFGDYRLGRFMWRLEDVEPFVFCPPFKGHQRLFRVPRDVCAAAHRVQGGLITGSKGNPAPPSVVSALRAAAEAFGGDE